MPITREPNLQLTPTFPRYKEIEVLYSRIALTAGAQSAVVQNVNEHGNPSPSPFHNASLAGRRMKPRHTLV